MQIGDLEDIYPIGVGDTARRYRALPRAAVVGRNLAAANDNVVSEHLAAFPALRMLIDSGQAAWRAIRAVSIQTET